MEEEPKLRRISLKEGKPVHISSSRSLWCGKVQGLCDGHLCTTCHLFPSSSGASSVERDSTMDSPTLTDHKKIGLTGDKD